MRLGINLIIIIWLITFLVRQVEIRIFTDLDQGIAFYNTSYAEEESDFSYLRWKKNLRRSVFKARSNIYDGNFLQK